MTEQTENNVLLSFLFENGHITEEQRDAIVIFASQNGVSQTTAILESNILGDASEVIAIIAEESGFDFVRLDSIEIDREALSHLDQKHAMQLKAIPYAFVDGALHVAVPVQSAKNIQLKNDLRRLTKCGVIHIAIATKKDIIRSIETLYRNDAELQRLAESSKRDDAAAASQDEIPEEITGESDVVRFVDLILRQGVKDKASDIHFDPQEHALVIRYRIDGILQYVAEAPTFMIAEIVSRVKIMSNLDISKTREPQDGRLEYEVENRPIDFRIATLPSIHGEKIVMRILDNSSAQLALSDLGFSEANLTRFRSASLKPYGVLLVTGPTGSGKSTTLYAALNEINAPEVNIITAEDPIEYQLPGITQVAVHHTLTFEKVLRTVLRADPDVILIGEIRDRETAEIAMKAGMTGHMVFSTLHTNDAASALTRLGDMGIEPFITGSTVEGIVSQRLVRRLCVKCKEQVFPTDIELEALGFNWDYWDEDTMGQPNFCKPVGCKQCKNSGYKGRLAIHEVLLMDDAMEEAVIKGAKALELQKLAVEKGMITLRTDGLLKSAQGLTTIQEIVRVVA